MSNKITVEMTFGQAMSLVETLKAVHADSDYYVERSLKGDLADLSEHGYALNDAERNVEKRARVAALVTMITGEPFGNPNEAAELAAIREAVTAYDAAKVAEAEAEKALSEAF